MKNKVVGIFNQKGGVGKSVLTINLATNIYIGENKERDPNFVCVYDGDIPQFSIAHLRKYEQKILAERQDLDYDYYVNKYWNMYEDDFLPFQIYAAEDDSTNKESSSAVSVLLQIKKHVSILREKYKVSFVDLAGTVNLEGYDDTFLQQFDHIIIPTNLDYEVLRSTSDFVQIAQAYNIKYSLLLNNIDGREKNAAEDLKLEFKENNIPIFDSIIYRKKKYITPYLGDQSGGMLSTIYNSYDLSFQKLIDELFVEFNK